MQISLKISLWMKKKNGATITEVFHHKNITGYIINQKFFHDHIKIKKVFSLINIDLYYSLSSMHAKKTSVSDVCYQFFNNKGAKICMHFC